MADDWDLPEPAAPAGRREPTAIRWFALLGAVVAAGIAVNVLTGGNATPTEPAPPVPDDEVTTTLVLPELSRRSAGNPGCPVTLGGLELSDNPTPVGAAVERWATSGRYPRQRAVVRRTADGALAVNSAAITWPLAADEVRVTGLQPTADGTRREFAWPEAGDFARIRGNLSEAELIRVAEGIQVQQGLLMVAPPVGYTLVYGGRCDQEAAHEIRYSPSAAGLSPVFGYDGMLFAGLQRAGRFEDQLLATGTRRVGLVNGKPAMLARLGSATVAWEPTPGLVAYIGYSGPEQTQTRIDTLLALGQRAHLLTVEEFNRLVR